MKSFCQGFCFVLGAWLALKCVGYTVTVEKTKKDRD